MIKTISNGVIRINNLSFFEFSNSLKGYCFTDKKSGSKVPKFILFWKRLSVIQVKEKYNSVARVYHNDY